MLLSWEKWERGSSSTPEYDRTCMEVISLAFGACDWNKESFASGNAVESVSATLGCSSWPGPAPTQPLPEGWGSEGWGTRAAGMCWGGSEVPDGYKCQDPNSKAATVCRAPPHSTDWRR